MSITPRSENQKRQEVNPVPRAGRTPDLPGPRRDPEAGVQEKRVVSTCRRCRWCRWQAVSGGRQVPSR